MPNNPKLIHADGTVSGAFSPPDAIVLTRRSLFLERIDEQSRPYPVKSAVSAAAGDRIVGPFR